MVNFFLDMGHMSVPELLWDRFFWTGLIIPCGKFWKRWECHHLTFLLKNLSAGQEATVTGHETTDWFQIGKGVCQGCILSPCFFNLNAEYIMRNAGLEGTQAGIKIARRNINNLRYADYTFPGGLTDKESTCNVGDLGLIPGSGKSPGEGNGNPLQYSCLENPMDRAVWKVTVHGAAKSRTRLSDFNSPPLWQKVKKN